MSVAFTYNTETKEYREYLEHQVDQLVADLNSASLAVAHNGLGFDKPALEKLTGVDITTPIYDTLVGARLLAPDLVGGHSLDSWGKRLGVLKGTVNEGAEDVEQKYGVYSEELADYCKQDVTVTVKLLEHQLKRGLDPSKLLVDYMGDFLDEHRPSPVVRA